MTRAFVHTHASYAPEPKVHVELDSCWGLVPAGMFGVGLCLGRSKIELCRLVRLRNLMLASSRA